MVVVVLLLVLIVNAANVAAAAAANGTVVAPATADVGQPSLLASSFFLLFEMESFTCNGKETVSFNRTNANIKCGQLIAMKHMIVLHMCIPGLEEDGRSRPRTMLTL